jgi:hypothetical protein
MFARGRFLQRRAATVIWCFQNEHLECRYNITVVPYQNLIGEYTFTLVNGGGSSSMRHEEQPTRLAQSTTEFKVNFQMSYMGARHACSTVIQASNEKEARALFLENWSTIEAIARERLGAT